MNPVASLHHFSVDHSVRPKRGRMRKDKDPFRMGIGRQVHALLESPPSEKSGTDEGIHLPHKIERCRFSQEKTGSSIRRLPLACSKIHPDLSSDFSTAESSIEARIRSHEPCSPPFFRPWSRRRLSALCLLPIAVRQQKSLRCPRESQGQQECLSRRRISARATWRMAHH